MHSTRLTLFEAIIALAAILSAKSIFSSLAFAADPPPATDSKPPALIPPPTTWDKRVTDAFPEDPAKLLQGPRPQWLTDAALGKAKPGAKGNLAGAGPADNSAGAKTGSALPWSKIISADTLQDEIKSLQPLLADDVKTQPSFLGGDYKKSRKTLSLLAVAFAIINEYDGDIRWKNQAPVARDLFARAGFNCKAGTEPVFRETKQCAEDIGNLLHGETLSGGKAEPTNEWSKVSNLLPLMSRLETAQRDRIAPWTSNAADFKKNSAALTHESEMAAALAEAISRPGMENAEDEKFHQYAKALQKSALDLRDAINAGNYSSANSAAGTLSKACANCHNDFR